MSQEPKKSKPLPHDPVLEAEQRARREELAANPGVQRMISLAQSQELQNRMNELKGCESDLRRMKLAANRGNFQAALAGYDRIYARMTRLAEGIAGATGATVDIPGYDPPVESSGKPRVSIGAATPSTSYRETKGLGPSGRGIEPQIPGSAGDSEWTRK